MMHGIVVDGSTQMDTDESQMDGEGEFPPFALFDIDGQENLDLHETKHTRFLTRATAEEALSAHLAGVEAADLPLDPLWRVPAGYRPLMAHEIITRGCLVVSQREEIDEANDGRTRYTPRGAVWIVDELPSGPPRGGSLTIICYRTGASIMPTEDELRTDHYRLFTHLSVQP